MPSDNNQEMFPIVDEHPSSRFQFERRFISAETSGMERHPARKMGHSRWRTY